MSRRKIWQCKHIPLRAILEACEACHARGGPLPYRALQEAFPGAPMKVIEAAMMKAFDRGLVDYGATVCWAWLTDTGWAHLEGGPAAATLLEQTKTTFTLEKVERLTKEAM